MIDGCAPFGAATWRKRSMTCGRGVHPLWDTCRGGGPLGRPMGGPRLAIASAGRLFTHQTQAMEAISCNHAAGPSRRTSRRGKGARHHRAPPAVTLKGCSARWRHNLTRGCGTDRKRPYPPLHRHSVGATPLGGKHHHLISTSSLVVTAPAGLSSCHPMNQK